MPWTPAPFTGGVIWQDKPSVASALSAANLNQDENAEAAYAVALAQSVVDYFTAQLAVNVKDKGAKGDGVADDSTAIQVAINAAFGAGIAQQPTVGGTVFFPRGTYIAQGLVLKGGVHLRGGGIGGNEFSDTDANLPPAGAFLKLKAGSTQDLIVTDNFAALNAAPGSATAYNTPQRCGIYDMVLDGNKFGASGGGRCLAAFARTLTLERVLFQNAAAADGVYISGPTGGGDTELMMNNFRVTSCAGNGLNLQGDHDMELQQGVVNNNGGIGIIEGAALGTSVFTNIHSYANGGYQWRLGSANASHVNCISDGSPGVQLLANAVQWRGGSIYGVVLPTDELVCIGDGTARTVHGCVFDTAIFQLGLGGRMFRYRSNTTVGWNKFVAAANLGGNLSNLFAGDGYATASGPIASTATTITVVQSATPVVAGTVVVSDGAHRTTAVVSSITGGNVLNLSGALGTAMNAGSSNIVVWNTVPVPADWYELSDADGGSVGFYQRQANPSGSSVMQDFNGLSLLGRLTLNDGNGHFRGGVYSCDGTPQGQVSGLTGDLCFRRDGGVGTFIYRCTGTTNWTAVV